MSLPSLFLQFSVSAHFPSKQPISPSRLPPASAREHARSQGGLQSATPAMVLFICVCFTSYRCEEHPCPQGAVGSTLEQHKQLSLRCIQAGVPPCPRVSPAVRATGARHRLCTATPLTYTLRNGLKIPPLAQECPCFAPGFAGKIQIPQGPDAPASLVPDTGRWDASEMAGGGHGIFHPSPLLFCSPAAWPPAWEGQRGAGGAPAM